MCGIAGLFDPKSTMAPATRAGVVRAMCDRIAHRGPDGEGFWSDPEPGIVFGHRRLAILDLSQAGHQPMTSADGRWVVSYNGELYNAPEIRDRLEQERGPHPWRGHSDTEILLEAVAAWGIAVTLERANGMFALALWDRAEHALWLARDRMGEKPLAYGWHQGAFVFASELAAFEVLPPPLPAIDASVARAFLHWGCVPAPSTILDGFAKLPPGTYARVPASPDAAVLPVAFWSAAGAAEAAEAAPFQGSLADAGAALEDLLTDAVRIRLATDVPLGAFLSGGIDSSLVCAILRKRLGLPLATFTVGFAHADQDESPHAAAVAAHLGTDHTTAMAETADALSLVPQLADVWDEPFADASQIPTLQLARRARGRVSVALTGDGGDEGFGGYPRVWQAADRWSRRSWMPIGMHRLIGRGAQAVPSEAIDALFGPLGGPRGARIGSKLRKGLSAWGIADFAGLAAAQHARVPNPAAVMLHPVEERRSPFDETAAAPQVADPMRALLAWDAATYLPDMLQVKMDRAAMSVGLETRAPLLDHRLFAFAWSLPTAWLRRGPRAGKQPLLSVLEKYVPATLIERPKQGFDPPLAEWLAGPLRDWGEALISPQALSRGGLLSPTAVRRRWDQLCAGRTGLRYEVWAIVMLQAWLEARRARLPVLRAGDARPSPGVVPPLPPTGTAPRGFAAD